MYCLATFSVQRPLHTVPIVDAYMQGGFPPLWYIYMPPSAELFFIPRGDNIYLPLIVINATSSIDHINYLK